MTVEIFFQISESGEEGAVGVAGFRGWHKSMSQFAHAGQRSTGVIVLVEQAGHRAVEGHCGDVAPHEDIHRGKEDLQTWHPLQGEVPEIYGNTRTDYDPAAVTGALTGRRFYRIEVERD